MHRMITSKFTPLIFVLAAASAPGLAQDSSRERADQIAQALNLEQLLSDRREEGVRAARQQMQSVITELQASGVSKEVIARLTPLAEQFAVKVASSWDAKEAARIYSTGLTEFLTDQEISDASRYYSSERGKRSYAALQASLAKTSDYINSRMNAVVQTELREFLRQVKENVGRK